MHLSVFKTILPFLKSVSNAIIREFDEYLYFLLLNMHLKRFAGLLNLTAFPYPPRLKFNQFFKERLSNLLDWVAFENRYSILFLFDILEFTLFYIQTIDTAFWKNFLHTVFRKYTSHYQSTHLCIFAVSLRVP